MVLQKKNILYQQVVYQVFTDLQNELIADVDPYGEVAFNLIPTHLKILREQMKIYFPPLHVEKYDWVRNPFAITTDISQCDIANIMPNSRLVEQKQLLETQSNRSFVH